MLTIRMLGELAVLRDGVAQPLPPSKKTRALLGYLVATGRPRRRERLCTLLWDVPDDPRGALRWSLSKLRGLVDEPGGPARILADRDSVGYAPEGAQSDLLALRQVCAQPLARAATGMLADVAASVGGEFLAGLDLPAQPDFQAWCLAEREDTRRQHAAVLEELVNRLLAAAPEEAVGHARRWVELDGFDAKSRAALVGLLVRLGRRAEAEQHCETGLRMLQEAGLPPGPLGAAARELRGRPSLAAPTQAEAGPAPTDAAVLAGGAGRLIIVDDEPEIGRMVAEYLGRHGFAVRTATNGRALRQLLAEEPADLVILDVNMPGEDGFAVARSLGVGTGGPRILFLTAAIDVVDRVVGLELGAEDYITKPFDLRELRARVRNVLRRVEEAAGESQASPAPHEPEGEPTPVLRQEIRFCLAADRVRIAYATSGEGPPLLKPSNWLTHLEFDWESPVWRHWMRELSRGRRLVRYHYVGTLSAVLRCL